MKCNEHDPQQGKTERQTTLLMLGVFAGIGGTCAMVIAFPVLLPFLSLLAIGVAKIMSNIKATDIDTLLISCDNSLS